MKYIVLFFLLPLACNPVSYETEQTVPYCEVEGTVWYIVGTQNNLDEYIFYHDSVIIWQYNYSQYDYQVLSIIKRKLEILEKNISYRDGDDQLLLLQSYKGYTVTTSGARPYDWSTYAYIFFAGITPDILYMGMFDELEDVQSYWTFYSVPPVELDFSLFN